MIAPLLVSFLLLAPSRGAPAQPAPERHEIEYSGPVRRNLYVKQTFNADRSASASAWRYQFSAPTCWYGCSYYGCYYGGGYPRFITAAYGYWGGCW